MVSFMVKEYQPFQFVKFSKNIQNSQTEAGLSNKGVETQQLRVHIIHNMQTDLKVFDLFAN